VEWLRESVRTRHLIINDAKALIHIVAGTAFLVSPGLFQRYAREHPDVVRTARANGLGDWQWVQKQFEHLRYHRKQENGRNIWTCEVLGARRRRKLHNYLLVAPGKIFDEIPPDNPFLMLPAEKPRSAGNAA
jgi:hypothetical protein